MKECGFLYGTQVRHTQHKHQPSQPINSRAVHKQSQSITSTHKHKQSNQINSRPKTQTATANQITWGRKQSWSIKSNERSSPATDNRVRPTKTSTQTRTPWHSKPINLERNIKQSVNMEGFLFSPKLRKNGCFLFGFLKFQEAFRGFICLFFYQRWLVAWRSHFLHK